MKKVLLTLTVAAMFAACGNKSETTPETPAEAPATETPAPETTPMETPAPADTTSVPTETTPATETPAH